MNKLITTLAMCCFLFCGCTDRQSDIPVLPQPEANLSSNIRTVEEAIAMANTVMQECYPENNSRAIGRTTSRQNVITKYLNAGRSNDDVLYYVVNFDNKQGFAIIPGEKIAIDAIAVVPEGEYNEENNSEGLKVMMDYAESYLTSQRIDLDPKPTLPIDTAAYPRDPYPVITNPTDTVYHYECAPLLPLEWGQDNFYGKYCPNGLTGCAPLAVATLATYFHYRNHTPDTRISYTFPEREKDSEVYIWEELYKHKRIFGAVDGELRPHTCYAKDMEYSHNAIAALCRQIGLEMNATYQGDINNIHNPEIAITFTFKHTYLPSLKRHLPSNLIIEPLKEYKSTQVNTYIDNGLLFMRAGPYSNNAIAGHAFIADGYIIGKYIDNYVAYNHETNKFYEAHSTRNVCKIHFRLGYHGQDDGYYAGEIFTFNSAKYAYPEFIAIHTK